MSEQKTRIVADTEVPVYTVEELRTAKLSQVIAGTFHALQHIGTLALISEHVPPGINGTKYEEQVREMAQLACDRLSAHLRGDFEEVLRIHEQGVNRIGALVELSHHDVEEASRG